ncbi:MAG: DUF1598 domain-containing protein [Planctomycetota bacterium]
MRSESRLFCQSVLVCRAVLVLGVVAVACRVEAGGLIRGGAVGGIHIDTDGVVTTPQIDDEAALETKWRSGLAPVPGDLQQMTDLRFVSLRGLEAEIAKARAAGEDLPDAVRYTAGLLRVKHVFVYPMQNDIVLAGPAEGWRVDSLGNTVGATTGRPVVFLEDLIVALRAAESETGAISCSIDPTAEGLQRVARVQREFTPGMSPRLAGQKIERALGQQTVSVDGVPATSHFARVLVAADFRMKRLAMDFEPAPVSNLPSYLDMLPERGRPPRNLLPRWWLATNYEPIARNAEGTAWEIRGQGVKCETENDFVDAQGGRTRSEKTNSFARKWADRLTESFEELANEDSSFGHLRNVMDLSVATAVIAKHDLLRKTGLALPWLLEKEQIEEYPAPRSVASQASYLRKGSKWIISASGGVQMLPWQVADKTETLDTTPAEREQALAKRGELWWWE